MCSIKLMVIRISDLERSRAWYESLGLDLQSEQHGNGPLHYACVLGGTVFELYPASEKNPVSLGVRLGFSVRRIRERLATSPLAESVVQQPAIIEGRLRAVLVDPDGIKVEVAEECQAGSE
jgi:catechol 2,3-dioxygenase-like lactoylglutathione lyase family enzyme